jgi:hypothetical protein
MVQAATMRALVLALLSLSACSTPPALLTEARQLELLRTLQREVARSVESEKSAVLAITDEESERYAKESREAATQVERARVELRTLLSSEELAKLDAFDAAWAKVAQIDATLLPLAVANTNLKAAKLSEGEAAKRLALLVDALAAAQGKTSDPARLRALCEASVAALWIQTLHAPHIAAPEAEVMSSLEARIATLEGQVDRVLAARPALPSEALSAWEDYQALTKQILALSRANTNVISFSMSVHEKHDASIACDAALTELAGAIHRGHRPTR